MDSVPLVFSERVAAFWKCCDNPYYGGRHTHRRIPDCEWTRISRKRRIEFYVVMENGKWTYGFGDPKEMDADRFLAMDELKNSPGLKNVVIREICVYDKWLNPDTVAKLRPLDVDIEVLMKFVLFLSNEPFLRVHSLWHTFPETFASPEESTLLNFLQEMHFSHVYFHHYNANYNRLLERQYSRRKATRIHVTSIESGKEFLEAELAAVRMKKCKISESLSPYVVDAIVARFLEDPNQFGEDYEIYCYFTIDETAKIFCEMREKTRFVREYANEKTGKTEFAVEGANRKVLTINSQFGLTLTMSA